jgi:hypothetical protein
MQKRLSVKHVVCVGICSRARACRALGLSRSTAYYQSDKTAERLAQEALVAEVSRENPEYGYRKVTAILRTNHEESINPKRVARLRRRDDLLASRRPGKRRRVNPESAQRRRATHQDEVWSYDFISTRRSSRSRTLPISARAFTPRLNMASQASLSLTNSKFSSTRCSAGRQRSESSSPSVSWS